MSVNENIRAILAATLLFLPLHVQAQPTSSIAVRAVVPPLAEIIAARTNGAVGDWTALGSSGALMLDMPLAFQAVGQSDVRTVSVFRSDTNRFNLLAESKDGGYKALTPKSISHGDKLTRIDYPAQAETLSPDVPPEARLTLSAL